MSNVIITPQHKAQQEKLLSLVSQFLQEQDYEKASEIAFVNRHMFHGVFEFNPLHKLFLDMRPRKMVCPTCQNKAESVFIPSKFIYEIKCSNCETMNNEEIENNFDKLSKMRVVLKKEETDYIHSLTLKQAKELQSIAEDSIRDALNVFISMTGLNVSGVHLNKNSIDGNVDLIKLDIAF